MEFFSVNNSSN